MYNELYEFWNHELQNIELEKLPPDFYLKIAGYLKDLKEESRMLDKRTIKASLLKSQMKNVRRMLCELLQVRYRKIVEKTGKGQKIPIDFLTGEEEKMCKSFLPLAEAYTNFLKSLLQGRFPIMGVESKHKRAVLRILKDIPAITGADMKTYGQFKAEDVVTLPNENAELLMKQRLAEKIEAD